MMHATSNFSTIRRACAQARRESQARHRDIAQSLRISEGELIAAHAGRPEAGMSVLRLRGPWPALIESLEPVGEVMALTRNESCVHEKTGVYRDASHSGHVGLVLGGAIDLRVFYGHWAHGYAVDETMASGPQRSLQFFDASGTAVHKIFQRGRTDSTAWDALVARYADEAQIAGIAIEPSPAREPERLDSRVDLEDFRGAWAAMTDTHEFFGLLRRHGVTRTQALRLAHPQFAQPAAPALVKRVLNDAARNGVPLMVFVGNRGMIQIHSGPVQRVTVMGPWLNVLDPGFSLHLRADHVDRAWIVRKPTCDGIVTSLELFDAEGETIAMVFGERKPGRSELTEWRQLVADAAASLTGEGAPCRV
jgi:putative hemin transport protein